MNGCGRVLALRPQVGAQTPAGDSAVRHVVNQNCQRARANMDTRNLIKVVQCAVDGPRTDAASVGDGLGGMAGREGDSHSNPNLTFFVTHVKGQSHKISEIAKNGRNDHPSRMARPRLPADTDPWPQRQRFLELLKAKIDSGLSMEQIAESLGLDKTASLEHSYRYDRTRTPKRQVMEKAAPYFGVELWEIYGAKPPEAAEKDELTLAKEALAGAMGADVVAKLTDEQIVSAYRVAMATAKAMLAQ